MPKPPKYSSEIADSQNWIWPVSKLVAALWTIHKLSTFVAKRYAGKLALGLFVELEELKVRSWMHSFVVFAIEGILDPIKDVVESQVSKVISF